MVFGPAISRMPVSLSLFLRGSPVRTPNSILDVYRWGVSIGSGACWEDGRLVVDLYLSEWAQPGSNPP